MKNAVALERQFRKQKGAMNTIEDTGIVSMVHFDAKAKMRRNQVQNKNEYYEKCITFCGCS